MASYLPQSAHPQDVLFKSHDDAKYLGDEMGYTYGDNKQKMTTKAQDASILIRNAPAHLLPVVKKFLTGQSVSAATEIAGMLPYNSTLRAEVQSKTVAMLFNSLQHPPASYLGDEHQYRTADGSNHNFLYPDFGKAGKPYAKTVRSAKKLHGTKPDPGLLFDLLQGRDEFKPNPNGISSMFLYHATILIHDLFNTNRKDINISDTSSYLDLAPLYGSTQEQQNAVRLRKDGLLKPDTFHEARLLGQPPGVNVLLVLYSRFHNQVATMLAEINEDGRFSLPEDPSEEDVAKRDNDIFQTARLVVGGLYINICLGDYLRAIQGVHEKETTWNFDPRMEIEKTDDREALPRGMGNQVSCEFSLLYRFHSAISKDDADWTEFFFKKCLPADLRHKSLEELTVEDMHSMMNTFAAQRSSEPSTREFGGLKRGPDGRFDDVKLAEILKNKIDDPAGVFGAKHVPKALRVVEMAAVVAARKWEVASLNEFRTFFGMEPHKTFESINSDPKIADALRNLYDSPDMVEMYPGIFIEEISKASEGIRFPPAAGRGVLSDAVTLVRSDRFYTLDYTTATLTNWGLCEAASDYKTLGGSMFHKLLHRGLPGYFDFNSVYAMQPMYTSAANEKIVKKLGTLDQYSLKPPVAPKALVVEDSHAKIVALLQNKKEYQVAWPRSSKVAAPDALVANYNRWQQSMLGDKIYQQTKPKAMFLDYLAHKAVAYLERDSFELGKSWFQVDFVRDVAIPVNIRFLADLFHLNVRTTTNKDGIHSTSELYKMLVEVRAWLDAPDPDHAAKWYKRRKAEEHTGPLTESTMESMAQIDPKTWSASFMSMLGFGTQEADQTPTLLRDVGGLIAKEVSKAVNDPKEAAHLLWMLAVSGVGAPVTAIAEVLEFYLSSHNSSHWSAITKLAQADSAKADAELEKYFLEAHRLNSAQLVKHMSSNNQEILLDIGAANRDSSAFSKPHEFSLDRPVEDYIVHGYGPRGKLGRDMFLAYGTAMLKVAARTKGLRRAPGAMGELKKVSVKGRRHYLTADWAYVVDEPTTASHDVAGPSFHHLPAYLKSISSRHPTDIADGPFQYAHKTTSPFFVWLHERPELASCFNNYMAGYRAGKPSWVDPGFYPVEERLGNGMKKEGREEEKAVLLVDVGGGLGQDLSLLRQKHPDVPGRLILQDKAEVLGQIGVTADTVFEKMAHDFFTPQPVHGARAYHLHSVLHDWDDDSCLSILKNITSAMEKGYSKLLINELAVPDQGASWSVTSMDWLMLALGAVKERTENDWRALVEQAGLKVTGIWTVEQGSESLMECELA